MEEQGSTEQEVGYRRLAILLVDDERQILAAFARRLRGQELRTAINIKEAIAHLDAGFEPDVAIADWNLGDGTFGSEFLAIVKSRYPKARRLLVSGTPERIPKDKVADLAHEVIDKISPRLAEVFEQLRAGIVPSP